MSISYPPEVQETIILAQDKFTWEVPSHAQYERSPRWYLITGLIALGLIAYAIWTANFLFAFLILLMAMLFVLAGNQPAKSVLVQIGDHGIVVDGKLYLYQNLDNFSVIYQPPLSQVLYFEHRNSVIPRLRLPLAEENPIELREHLRQYVRENLDLQDEHLSDIVARLLKI